MENSLLFIEFVTVLENISKTSSRLEKQNILSDFLKKVFKEDKESLSPMLFMSNAQVFPTFDNLELGIGDFLLKKCVSEATSLTIKSINEKLIKSGDLSLVAMENKLKPLILINKKLTLKEVFSNLRKICKETGKNSNNIKKNIILNLINLCSPLEIKYLIRILETKLKIGLALQTILISLAQALDSDPTIIKNIYNKNPDFENLIKLIFKYEVEDLEKHCKIVPGIPLRPMLAVPTSNLTKTLDKIKEKNIISEFKYDGERVQIHFNKNIENEDKKNSMGSFVKKTKIEENNNKIKIFSRNSENITEKYFDISSLNLNKKSFILDGEAVAFSENKILPFQMLTTRKRKNVKNVEVKICVFIFDILFFDDKELLSLTLKERRKILKENFKEIKGKFEFAKSLENSNFEEIEGFFKDSIKNSCEGLIIKLGESPYLLSHRSNQWIKLKKDYLDNLGDTMDLVVIGAYYGKGKRTGGYGGFLLGVYNEENENYESCCKIGTGFTEEDLKLFYEILVITADRTEIVSEQTPDVWIKPQHVWEVKAASLSLSPVYSAGKTNDRGISLRFPRFIKKREDKGPKEATTSNQILMMYNDEINNDDEFN